eukprot:scaffold3673_cov393-Prasinococcus_capsulatus_cf.AAC.3
MGPPQGRQDIAYQSLLNVIDMIPGVPDAQMQSKQEKWKLAQHVSLRLPMRNLVVLSVCSALQPGIAMKGRTRSYKHLHYVE